MLNKNQIKTAIGLPKIVPISGPFTLADFEGNQEMYDAYLSVSSMAERMDKKVSSELAERNNRGNQEI